MENTNTKNITYNAFDVAKFICSILVVMIHVPPFGQQANVNFFSYLNFGLSQCLCRIAVPLFFIFNGFFLYRKTSLDNFSIKPTKKYFVHILKLYLLWSLLYFPLNLINILKNPTHITFELVIYIKNVICLGSHKHLWYLNALLGAVAIVSFLLHNNWSPKKILCTASVFYVFGLLLFNIYITTLFYIRF